MSLTLEEHKQDLINGLNSSECLTKNQFIALLELKKFEICKELFEQ